MMYLLKGDTFGRLTATTDASKSSDYIIFLCECEDLKKIRSDHVKTGATISCGCARVDNGRRPSIWAKTHGLGEHPLVKVHWHMMSRCYDPKDVAYSDYGGRGISVDPRWHNVNDFFSDVVEGYNKNLQLDRIDNNQGYSKNNCRWATVRENANNKRNNVILEIDGEVKTLSYWADDPRAAVGYSTMNTRYLRGWKPKDIVFSPPRKPGTKKKGDVRIIND